MFELYGITKYGMFDFVSDGDMELIPDWVSETEDPT